MKVKAVFEALEPFGIFIVVGIMLIVGLCVWAYDSHISTQEHISGDLKGQVVIVGMNPVEIPPIPGEVDKTDARYSLLWGEWVATCLVSEAQKQGIEVKVLTVGDKCRDENGRPYQNAVIEFSEKYDAFDVIQKLVLIDFVHIVANNEHQATKTGCVLQVK